MHRSRITATAGLVAALSLWGAGCREEGPAEQAGRAIDEAAESAGEGVQGLGDGPFEDAGEEADEAVEEAMEAVEDAID